ncbi:MAG: Lipoprotein-releasing system ATP-binding protein LolD, partial [uncultured Gemmatimonadaceae bacterium]
DDPRSARRGEVLPRRRRRHPPHLERGDAVGRPRRDGRRRRGERGGQEHAAPRARRARPAVAGDGDDRGRSDRGADRRGAGRAPEPEGRFRVPVPPPAAGVLGAGERCDAATDCWDERPGRAEPGRRTPRPRRPQRPPPAPAERALGRGAAAHRRGAGAGGGPGGPPGGRAVREPGSHERREAARAVHGAGARPRAGDGRRDPQPLARGAGGPRAAPGGRSAGRHGRRRGRDV